MVNTKLAAASVASVLFALPFTASADSGHAHEAESSSLGAHDGSMPRSENLADAWKALMAARDSIGNDLDSGALDDVHASAEALPTLAIALLEQSGDLDAAKRARVEGAANQVTRVAHALHKAADGGDAARTRKELSRLDGLLELIRAQYSPSALGTDDHGHGGHSAVPGDAQGVHANAAGPTGVVEAVV